MNTTPPGHPPPQPYTRRFVKDASLTKSQLSYALVQRRQAEAAHRAGECRLQWRNVILESTSQMNALRSVRNKGVLKVGRGDVCGAGGGAWVGGGALGGAGVRGCGWSWRAGGFEAFGDW